MNHSETYHAWIHNQDALHEEQHYCNRLVLNSNRSPVQQWYIHIYNLPNKIYLLTLEVHFWGKMHPKFFTKLMKRKLSCINWSLQCACTIFCNIIEKLLLTTWLGAPCWTLSPIEHFRTEWPMFFNLLPRIWYATLLSVSSFKLGLAYPLDQVTT